MIAYSESEMKQIPLIHIIDESERILLSSENAEWYRILYYFPWQEYRTLAAKYYDALWDFNLKEAEKKTQKIESLPSSQPTSKDDAKLELLFGRPTMDRLTGKSSSILFEGFAIDSSIPIPVLPQDIAPNKVPARFAGKTPKCFFALFKAFMGVSLMGFEPEPHRVHQILESNLAFAQVCGFIPKRENQGYHFQHCPSLRKIEQFDEIMRIYGLWDQIKWKEVKQNLKEKVIQIENELVADTTHYPAYSSFETVTYFDKNGKKQKKSQSKVTKKCHCPDKKSCAHPWELADDGAGTICKSNNKKHWGHKACDIGFPAQGIPLDAVAANDAATHDKQTILPQVERLFDHLPELEPHIQRLLYDSAGDSKDLKEQLEIKWNIDLKASINPRTKKPIMKNLPKGIQKLTPYGETFCLANISLDYKGVRWDQEKFIYQAPLDEKTGTSVCLSCPHRLTCCPNALTGRTVTIPFDLLPHIDPNDPPMAKRFKAIMTRRPAVERMIKRLKKDFGDDRLSKRGNPSFQAYLDKTMIAFHILLRN